MEDFLDVLGSCPQLDNYDEDIPEGMSFLYDLEPGTEFTVGTEKFILLEVDGASARVISKGFYENRAEFGENSDWKESRIRARLNTDYLARIADLVGAENIIPMQRDLTSLDGLDDYGSCEDMVSLLTAAEYAKYHRILGVNFRYSHWWWLITPATTPSNGYPRYVCCVDVDGIVNWGVCGNGCAVRPFFTLNSSVLVSTGHNE